jgi:hypothetical protein
VLVALFQRDGLSFPGVIFRELKHRAKFATVERRRQHTRRVRYPELGLPLL